jgi:hypothetical protein
LATFDDLFGKKSGKFIKWNEEGETLIFQISGEVDAAHPQRDFKSGSRKFLVETDEKKPDGKNKWKPMLETEFDPAVLEEKELGFFALTQIMIPVKVVGKKGKNNESVAGWEAFDAKWELSQNQEERLKEAMMEDRSIQLVPGTIIGAKLIDMSSKPRKYAIKLKAAE